MVDTLTGTLSASRTGSAPKVNRNAPIRTLTKHVVTRWAQPSQSQAVQRSGVSACAGRRS